MEEKKSLKIILSTFFLILAIIVIIIMTYYIYITKKESNKEIDDLKENAIGMQSTITDLRAKINTGTYVIENNTLTCNASKEEIYTGGTSIKDTNAIFEFKIINNNNIEFDTTQNISDKFELNKNFSYSVK